MLHRECHAIKKGTVTIRIPCLSFLIISLRIQRLLNICNDIIRILDTH